MDPRLEKLKARVTELIAWNEEITIALQQNPDSEERRRLAGELAYIQQEMRSIDGEREAITRGSPTHDSTARDSTTPDPNGPSAEKDDAS